MRQMSTQREGNTPFRRFYIPKAKIASLKEPKITLKSVICNMFFALFSSSSHSASSQTIALHSALRFWTTFAIFSALSGPCSRRAGEVHY